MSRPDFPSSKLEHTFSIQAGVMLMGERQVLVQIFEGSRFSDEVVIEIARHALNAGPATAFRDWTGPNIWHDSDDVNANPLDPFHYTAFVQFVEVVKKKS